MADLNNITAQCPATPTRRDLRKIDIITARHAQSLAILRTILADLSDESVLSRDVITNSLWAAQTLLEQAQEAAVTL